MTAFSQEVKELGDKMYSRRHDGNSCSHNSTQHDEAIVDEIHSLIFKGVSEGNISEAQFHLSVLQYVIEEYIG